MNKQELIKQLQKILPADAVLYQQEDLKPFECDGLSAYRELPLALRCLKQKSRCAIFCCCAAAQTCRWWRAVPARVCRAARCRLQTACC